MGRGSRTPLLRKSGTESNDSRHRGTLAIFGTLLALAIALPLSGIAALSVWDANNKLNDPDPLWVSVRTADSETRDVVDIVLEWNPVQSLVSPSWTGTVTAVEPITPEGIHTGDPVAEIDGVTRIAVHTTSPLYRAVSLGDRGPDVKILNGVLRQLGFNAGSGDLFTWTTLQGARQFAASIGVTNATQIRSFDPSWIVYLPTDGMTGSEFKLKVGSPAPGPGTELIAPTLRLTAGSLTLPGAAVPEASNAPEEIDVTQPVVTNIPESARFTMPEQAGLEYSGLDLEVDADSVLTPAAVALLSKYVDIGVKSVRALVVSESQVGSVMVPSSAIYATADGSLCVTRKVPKGMEGVAITVTSNEAGKSVVVGKLKATDEVLIGPKAGHRRCA